MRARMLPILSVEVGWVATRGMSLPAAEVKPATKGQRVYPGSDSGGLLGGGGPPQQIVSSLRFGSKSNSGPDLRSSQLQGSGERSYRSTCFISESGIRVNQRVHFFNILVHSYRCARRLLSSTKK